MKNTVPKGTYLLPVKNLTLNEGMNLITLETWEDLLLMATTTNTIYQIKNTYYIITDNITYLLEDQ